MPLVDLPLSYVAYCKPFRRRFSGSVDLLDFVTLPVREVSESEAPLAVEITDGSAVENLRFFEGKYWMRDVGLGPEAGKLRALLGLAQGYDKREARLAEGSIFLHNHFGQRDLEAFVTGTHRTVESERCREVTGDNRPVRLEQLQASVLRSHLFVDGVAYTAVNEPFLTLRITDSGEFYASVALGMPSLDWRENRTFVFPADRADDMEAVIRSVEASDALSLQVGMSAVYRFGETTPVRREAQDLLAIASDRIIVERVRMAEWPKARAMPWYDLRDAYAAVKSPEDRNDEGLDRLADALQAYGEVYDIGPFARAAIGRWRFREIELDAALALNA